MLLFSYPGELNSNAFRLISISVSCIHKIEEDMLQKEHLSQQYNTHASNQICLNYFAAKKVWEPQYNIYNNKSQGFIF